MRINEHSWIVIFCLLSFLSSGQQVEYVEYFIDTDPGYGNGTAISFAPDSTLDINLSLSTDDLATGFHIAYFRARDSEGNWGHLRKQLFYIQDAIPPIPSNLLASLEYFIDADPGFGNGNKLVLPMDSSVNINQAIPLSELSPGFHIIFFRTTDTSGSTGFLHKRLFFILEAHPPIPTNQLASLEYFIDSDPGSGNATRLVVPMDSTIDVNKTISLTGLSPGFHLVYLRSIDTAGSTGFLNKQLFFILGANPISPTNQLNALEYFIDSDPGFGNGTSVSITPDSSIAASIDFGTLSLKSGFHILYTRSQDSIGSWSQMQKMLFMIKEFPTSETLPKVVSIEYFLEVDSPYHGGYRLSIPNDSFINVVKTFHTLPIESGKRIERVRALDENGTWGLLTPTDSFTVLECEWVYNTQDTGLGSFRFAVNCANPGDTIHFDSTVYDQTLLLRLPRLDIHKDLFFASDSTYNITLSNGDIDNTQLLVFMDGNIYMRGLDLIGQSADSFIFKISNKGSFEFIEGKMEKVMIETP